LTAKAVRPPAPWKAPAGRLAACNARRASCPTTDTAPLDLACHSSGYCRWHDDCYDELQHPRLEDLCMAGHLRANLFLLLGTLVLCSVLYPAALWVIGQSTFRHQAEGSLIKNSRGEVIGSRLIAQPFKGDEYFQPRPSAANYKGDASGASNWGASNYLLRDRVARQLGPIMKYGKGAEAFGKKEGDGIQADIEAWFQKDQYRGKPGIVAQWARAHPVVAQGWVKDDKLKTAYVASWLEEWKKNSPDEYAKWLKENPSTPEPKAEDVAVPFFEAFSRSHGGADFIVEMGDVARAFVEASRKRPGWFPSIVERKTLDGQQAVKAVEPVQQGEDIQGYFFDMWRQEHPDVPLEPVPADMVMASGSGLDPHITLANANYQLKHRVAAAQAKKLLKIRSRKEWEDSFGRPLEEKIREEIVAVLREKKEAPLGGLVGVDLVNVLEVNMAMNVRMERLLANAE
jgi:K+-transporting ATPase ATPase C chain